MPPALALALLALAARDPRLALIEPQLAGRPDAALAAADAWREAEPAAAAAAGIEVLRGRLLARLGRADEARAALGAALGERFDPWARLELAGLEAAVGRGDAAVGLLAPLLAHAPPPALVPRAVDRLSASFSAPRDCRPLAGAALWRLPTEATRRIALHRADCLLAEGEAATARVLLASLLGVRDGVDLAAADRLLATGGPQTTETRRLGLLLFEHRDFARALPLLESALAGAGAPVTGETVYARARSLFWLGRYAEAEPRFVETAAAARAAADRADALYQAGRSAELAGDWPRASERFRACAAADEPGGSWAGACRISDLRLAWREGREEEALAGYAALATRRGWAETHGRAALFLASSDLVRGRGERASAWLDAAAGSAPRAEVAYWRGRLAELRAAAGEAIARYRDALLADPYDLFAQASRERLRDPALAETARATFASLERSGTRLDLLASLRFAGPQTEPARARLRQSWQADSRGAALAGLAPLPPAAWPLWQSLESHAGARLVALGLWDADPDALRRAFPTVPSSLAITRAHLLAASGSAHEAVRVAEGLVREAPDGFPEELLSTALRRLLYPDPFGEAVRDETAARGVDPLLLTALMREESRFDPEAVSASAAHGLTQFVLPTAQRLAPAIGRERLDLAELHDPEVAIALAASYLAELARRFDDEPSTMLAAYNAGEPQAALWQSYCFSRESTEYASKIGFRQTREYVRKVLRSWAVYRDLSRTVT